MSSCAVSRELKSQLLDYERQSSETPITEQLLQTINMLQSFRDKSLFTDVILCAGNEELSCHKAVLAASSKYFYAMFSSPYKEQQTSRVIFDHLSPWALRRLLDFAYTGILELSSTTVQDIFTAACLLDYPIAIKLCINYMESHLDITNCLGIEALAEMYDFSNLVKVARKLAIENFSSLLRESTEWVNLPLSTVLSYISLDDLDVPSEKLIWDACIKWIDHDPESRLSDLPTLLSHIRIKYLDKEFLVQQIEENSFLIECTKAQQIIKSFLSEISSENNNNNNNKELIHSNDQPPRPATFKRPNLVVLGGLNTCILNCMQSFSPSRKCWQLCPSMPVDSLAWFSVCVVSNILFVIGGIKAGTIMSTVYSYSPIHSQWIQRKSMPQARARHTCVTLGSRYIFVFGGLTMVSNSNRNNYEQIRMNSENNSADYSINTDLINNLSDSIPINSELPTLNFVHTIICYDLCTDQWSVVGFTDQPRLESHIVLISEYQPVDKLKSDEYIKFNDDHTNLDTNKNPTMLSESSVNNNNNGNNNNNNNGNGNDQLFTTICKTNNSTNSDFDHVFVEIGGITKTEPHGSEQVIFYRLKSDMSIFKTAEYIKLLQPVRYVNCAVHQQTNLLYIFWESTSELSVLDLRRHTLRPLAPLVTNSNLNHASEVRVHCGVVWIDELLYVVGGFSEFVGDDRRPTTPRDDVHCYNPATNTWSVAKVSHMTVPRAIFGCVCLNM